MRYEEKVRKALRLIPRLGVFMRGWRFRSPHLRKTGYREFSFEDGCWTDRRRLLKKEEIRSFVEISLRAAYCPMPINLDVYDGLVCPYGCIYCFANYFRYSLYTSFFDNWKEVGIRHCNPEFLKRHLGRLFERALGKDPAGLKGLEKAIAWRIPLRFGIRFEDFLGVEKRRRVALETMKFLNSWDYPYMINTKSALLGEDPEYLRVLSEGKAAVHLTLITHREELRKRLEPNAPSVDRRLRAARNLVEAGVRVVARMEPFIVGMTDEDARGYFSLLREVGIKNITLDTYSYSAVGTQVRELFFRKGLDLDKIQLLNCDSQPLASYWLGEFMEEARREGFSCSTFDMGNVPDNDQNICCEVEDWFTGSTFNWGSTVGAIRFVKMKRGKPCRWKDFVEWVEEKCGGFLTDKLQEACKRSWNGEDAYGLVWAKGMEPVGLDEDGIVWRYSEELSDFRQVLVEGCSYEV